MGDFISAWSVWLILAAVFVIIELLTNTFAAFCFVGGCLLAMIAALLGFSIYTQLSMAVVGIVVTFIALKPVIVKHIHQRAPRESLSNMDALIGRRARLTEAVCATTPGRLRLDGDNWQASDVDGGEIAAGEEVVVVGYESIILQVRRVTAE